MTKQKAREQTTEQTEETWAGRNQDTNSMTPERARSHTLAVAARTQSWALPHAAAI
jgi:hypothetical protein